MSSSWAHAIEISKFYFFAPKQQKQKDSFKRFTVQHQELFLYLDTLTADSQFTKLCKYEALFQKL
jgi:hypothetical protein